MQGSCRVCHKVYYQQFLVDQAVSGFDARYAGFMIQLLYCLFLNAESQSFSSLFFF